MLVDNLTFVNRVKALCGLSYDECDCIGVVTNALGIRCQGTNWLWRSIRNSAKYRYLSWRVADEPREGDLMPGDVVFMIRWERVPDGYTDCPDCHHIGVYVGNGKVVHSSPNVGVREAPFIESEWDGWGKMSMVVYPDFKASEPDEPEMTDRQLLEAIYNKVVKE